MRPVLVTGNGDSHLLDSQVKSNLSLLLLCKLETVVLDIIYVSCNQLELLAVWNCCLERVVEVDHVKVSVVRINVCHCRSHDTHTVTTSYAKYSRDNIHGCVNSRRECV